MKKILISLLIIGMIYFVSTFGPIKGMVIVGWFHNNKIYTNFVVKKVNNYLIKKYSLEKSELQLIQEKELSCDTAFPSTSQTVYCGKQFVFDVKGKTTIVTYHANGGEYNSITDNYQTEQISNDINEKFKSLLGDKVGLIYFDFYPVLRKNGWGIINADSFINYYDGNLENFFNHEHLNNINILILTDKSEKETTLKEYSSKLENYAKNYCSQSDRRLKKTHTSFNLFLFDKTVDLTDYIKTDLKFASFFSQDKGKYEPGVLCRYFYDCNELYDSNNHDYIGSECFKPDEISNY